MYFLEKLWNKEFIFNQNAVLPFQNEIYLDYTNIILFNARLDKHFI